MFGIGNIVKNLQRQHEVNKERQSLTAEQTELLALVDGLVKNVPIHSWNYKGKAGGGFIPRYDHSYSVIDDGLTITIGHAGSVRIPGSSRPPVNNHYVTIAREGEEILYLRESAAARGLYENLKSRAELESSTLPGRKIASDAI